MPGVNPPRGHSSVSHGQGIIVIIELAIVIGIIAGRNR